MAERFFAVDPASRATSSLSSTPNSSSSSWRASALRSACWAAAEETVTAVVLNIASISRSLCSFCCVMGPAIRVSWDTFSLDLEPTTVWL